jgi:hypothetical protein
VIWLLAQSTRRETIAMASLIVISLLYYRARTSRVRSRPVAAADVTQA